MKRKRLNLLIICFIMAFIILSFFYRTLISETLVYALTIFLHNVFPYLFIMIIMQKLLINYNFAYYLDNLLGKYFRKLFKLSSYGNLAFILAILGGTPTFAYVIKDLYQNNNITLEEANNLLMETFFPNPLFLYNYCYLILQNNYLSLKIIFILYSTNFIILFINRKTNKNNIIFKENRPLKIWKILPKAINESLNTNLMIFGTMTFFILITKFLTLYISNSLITAYLTGLLEMTQGLDVLTKIILSSNIKELIILIFITFGGLSIHLQVYSIIEDSNLEYKSFLRGRLLSLIYALIMCIITFLFNYWLNISNIYII